MICSNNPFQVLSDGKSLYVITGNSVGAFKLIDPFLTRYDITINQPMMDVNIFSDLDPHFMAGLQSVDLSFDVKASSVEHLADSKDVLLDFFQSASIRDLLKEINKKIEARGI